MTDAGRRTTAAECPFLGLDSLWIQVAGLSCNLRCAHCFNASGPGDRRMRRLSRKEVERLLDAAERAGVRDVVFTGGEPFVHAEMPEIAAQTLARFPVTILTNGTLLSDPAVDRLADGARGSRYSLEVRVSLDAASEVENDRIRGAGSFERALAGAVRLDRAGLLPVVTAVRFDGDGGSSPDEFENLLRARGIGRPRVKFLPLLRIGRQEKRAGGYSEDERATAAMIEALGADQLLCSSARVATAEGVWVCPILVNEPRGRLGASLEEAFRPFPLAFGACFTCLRYGAVCANAATVARDE